MNPLADRVAVVTGASRGIGFAIAEQLYAAGAVVVRVARGFQPGRSARRVDVACDVSDAEAVAAMARAVVDEVGIPDVVVNGAGSFLLKPLAEIEPDEFRRQLDANVVGPFLVFRAFLPHLLRRGSGHLVSLGSVADHQAFPGNTAYAASKYGLRGLHESLALELRGSGVRLTLVSPGPTDTSMWDALDPDGDPELPDRRSMLRPEHVADAVVFALTRPESVAVDWIRVTPGA